MKQELLFRKIIFIADRVSHPHIKPLKNEVSGLMQMQRYGREGGIE
jgi:hypothetical protein